MQMITNTYLVVSYAFLLETSHLLKGISLYIKSLHLSSEVKVEITTLPSVLWTQVTYKIPHPPTLDCSESSYNDTACKLCRLGESGDVFI